MNPDHETATDHEAATGHDVRRSLLEAAALREAAARQLECLRETAELIRTGNTAIMPTGEIVKRGTPGSRNYDSPNHRNLGPVKITAECRYLDGINPHPSSRFVERDGEIIEVSRAMIDEAGAKIKSAMEERQDAMMKAMKAAVVMFSPDFEAPILAGTKHHTIRPKRKRPLGIGSILKMRVWTARPYGSPQRQFHTAPVIELEGIRIHRNGVEISPGTMRVFWMGAGTARHRLLEQFAHDDGFSSWTEMRKRFEQMHGLKKPFEGTLIRWSHRSQ